jgi:DNA-binding MarR family transcriptional regulator
MITRSQIAAALVPHIGNPETFELTYAKLFRKLRAAEGWEGAGAKRVVETPGLVSSIEDFLRRDPATAAEISKSVRVAPTTLWPILRRLSKRGNLSRRRVPGPDAKHRYVWQYSIAEGQ